MTASTQAWLPFAVILLALATTGLSAPCQCVPQDQLIHVERFSSIKDINGLSGPGGIELILTEQGTRLTAELRDYEGLPDSFITKLKGTLENCDVDVHGTSHRGSVAVHGKIMIASFQGVITRQIGNKTFTERVSLRREPPLTNNTVGMSIGSSRLGSGSIVAGGTRTWRFALPMRG